MTWGFEPKNLESLYGFVYIITEKSTGLQYIGIKRFWKKKTLKPLKGRNNKRHSLVESDWRTYNTSSSLMQSKLKGNPGNYRKRILYLCGSQTELKCREAYLQLDYYMNGDWDKLFNEVVNLRVRIR